MELLHYKMYNIVSILILTKTNKLDVKLKLLTQAPL